MDYQKEILENQEVIMHSLINLLIRNKSSDIDLQYELYDRRNKTKEMMNNDNDQEIELKPCPFCGGKANMIKNECEENGFTGWFVFHDCRSLQDIRTKIKDTREEAADCWNKRYDKHETD